MYWQNIGDSNEHAFNGLNKQDVHINFYRMGMGKIKMGNKLGGGKTKTLGGAIALC